MGAWISYLFASPRKVVRLNGRKLVIKKQLGEGGFSYVYLVQDAADKHTYALKKMLCQTDELLETGNQEVRMLQMFHHPNILRLVDHQVVPSRTVPGAQDLLILLPYLKRGSLQGVLEYQRARFGAGTLTSPFSEAEALSLFSALCKAVQAFHLADPPLALRDIKPGNVLLTEQNEPVLMDFGSVAPARVAVTSRQQALHLQELSEQLCTPQFRAPELFNIPSECNIDERTDIWSLGCLLYALVYCRSPFETATSVALAVQSKIDYPATQFSPKTIELIQAMLVVDPSSRPFIQEVISRLPE